MLNGMSQPPFDPVMATDLMGVVPVLGWLPRIGLGEVLKQRGLVGFHLHQQVVTGGDNGFNRFFDSATRRG